MRIGLDIGSTTIKAVVLDTADNIIFKSYERHYSQITQKTAELLSRIQQEVTLNQPVQLTISGSAGMGMADSCGIPFVQEVYATRISANRLLPGTDAIIELGGEDAKILFLQGGMEVRMNGSCAGGTGAFIDQMATLLNVTPDEMNALAAEHEKIYTIASRCGVFAKTDIQPLLNQGARKNDVAASIFYAVVNQTIAGLAQGRPIAGKVLYLGGPLTFLSQLRESFDKTLKLTGTCPENSLYYVALGAAYCATETVDLSAALEKLANYQASGDFAYIEPLFQNEGEYMEFAERHAKASVPTGTLQDYKQGVFIGIDAGSTTVKTVVLGQDGNLLYSKYQSNSGNPVPLIKAFFEELYTLYPNIKIVSGAVTGYGEDIIKNAFCIDYGIVETVAHFTAAKQFMPSVDFVIDIGGQDIKCFKIHNGTVDNIYLNEACSSGCGSFLQTFAGAMGYSIADFAQKGLFADKPVDLGSRCTVFMNSSVKQAQKDGASTENISAGLSISVVKNALYKVIRPSSTEELGKHIVVQGGTFYNDAVLRAFEKELGLEVVRPDIAGLMGAYGAALYAQSQYRPDNAPTTILTAADLASFTHEVRVINCGLCPNNCRLTVNSFAGTRKFISGNRCERPVTNKKADDSLNLYQFKLHLLQSYTPVPGTKGKIGLPFGLNMYELLPFWHRFFSMLGFEVVTSPLSSRKLYLKGQATIPSDTVCFPAKLMHGHVEALIDMGVDTIFYPCMSYNIDEHISDNCYNCPVVAYYPEVLDANMPHLSGIKYIHDYVGLHREKDVPRKLYEMMQRHFEGQFTLTQIKHATKAAYEEYHSYMAKIQAEGDSIVAAAQADGKPIVVLAGRPYHVDPEINHGIDTLIAGFGVAVVSEDVIGSHVHEKLQVHVLNQWTYHSRLYAAAQYIAGHPNMNLVQLVSFGCGCDAITTDECREILEREGKIYTQIKIDEITNLGAVKIRLRSLFAATQGDDTRKL
ncbi:MAG: acyl-CoA dehydratase activase-related protein [Oscillospiraceae bacterium]|nr:acyl-CoA dehydratase activase-related protein [Oscillospiraceae bacterium]